METKNGLEVKRTHSSFRGLVVGSQLPLWVARKLPVTPALGDQTSSSYLCGHLHTYVAHRYIHIHIKNKINCKKHSTNTHTYIYTHTFMNKHEGLSTSISTDSIHTYVRTDIYTYSYISRRYT